MDTTANLKKKLRQTLLSQRRQLTQEQVAEYSQEVFENFKNVFDVGAFNGIEIMAGYSAIDNEVDIWPILHWVAQKGIKVALPKIIAGNLEFYEWNAKQDLATNRFGIKEPTSMVRLAPDYLLIPLIGFDESGNRLGYGFGYYDKAISLLPKAIKIGVGYSFQKIATIPSEPHDVKLKYVLTSS
jgi:5-formyltetrahydrofolate cyclo-ligase